MALQNRLDYGSRTFQVPAMPHVPKSAKRKRSVRRKAEDNPMCAFDLLATVAGQLLVESGTSADPFSVAGTSNSPPTKGSIQHTQLNNEWPCKLEGFGYVTTNKSSLNPASDCQRQGSSAAKGYNVHIQNTSLGHTSAFKKPSTSAKEASERKLKHNYTNGDVAHSLGTIPEKCSFESHSPGSVESSRYSSLDVIKTPQQTERQNKSAVKMIDGIAPGMCSVEDPMDLDTKPPALVSSDSSFEVPPCGGHIPRESSSPKSGDSMKLPVNRDNDENSSGCTNPSTSTTKAYVPQQIRDRRIRKLLVSRHRKVSPSMLRDGELSDSEMKSCNRKICFTRQRTQRCSFKRRKLYEHRTVSSYGGALCSEGKPNLPVKGHIKVETSDSLATLHGAHRASSSTTVQKPSYGSGDFNVKFSIKSFRVPELFIDIPENATVASLKRTVMEAVTDILGGGLRVGVLLQGKKVRDDSKTLLQTGISRGDQLGNLGFTLEPKPTQAQAPLPSSDKPQLLPPSDSSEPLTRIPDTISPSDYGSPKANLQPPLSLVASCPESDHDSVHSPTDISSLEKTTANSKALVPVPSMAVDALAVVPLCKSRRSELVQRRIRRPFSVNEVEALVQAVEKLGTGRWRDVKLRAFDNAKHRTYVDLKDKWKTLVHTARISPQQRRGEPVPQELLDRVLAAHAYWSQQQAKPPTAEACLLF